MKIIELYRQIIDYSGLKIDNDKVYIGEVANKDPFLVNGKQLVIPTNEVLRNIDGNSMVMFHPLSEDIIKGESSVVNKLRCAINSRINISIYVLMQSLINLAASPEHHKKLSPEQSELLYNIKDVDEKTSSNFVSYMLKEVKDKGDRLFSYIYLKRGGVIDGTKYPRVGIVSFPFFHSLLEGEKFKFRIKDVEVYKAVFEYIFSEAKDHEAYNYGSTSTIAPFFDALMITSYKLTERLNEVTELYRDYIDEPDNIMFNHDWYDLMRDPEPIKIEIRAIPGNVVEPTPHPEVVNPVPNYNRGPMQYPSNPSMVNNQLVQPNVTENLSELEKFRRLTGIGHNNYANNTFNPNPGYNRPAPYTGDVLNRPIYPNNMQPNMNPNVCYNSFNQFPNSNYPNNMNNNIPFNPMPYPNRY